MNLTPEMNQQIFQIILNVLGILIAVGSAFVISFLKKKLGIEKLKEIETEYNNKKNIVEIGIKFVQQVYANLDDKSKFNECMKWVSQRLKEKGINYSPDEIRGLIESVLKEIKLNLGEEWDKQVESK